MLAVYFLCGLFIFRDYGASSDEINQIEAGHITWTALCEKLGNPAPDFGNLPKLSEYYNRYYGQAATFPTVVIEALRGFKMDISNVLRMRHLWNFLIYFLGTVSLGILTKLRFRRNDVVFLLLLLYILIPRLFGEAFYNDRDTLLVALLWISLLCFELLHRKPCILSILLCAFTFALAINTRYFALILIILPIFCLLSKEGEKYRYLWILIGLVPLFFFLLTPALWDNFFAQFASGFRLFSSGKQRTQETMGLAKILFFGKLIPENDLPFYYVPLWIFISTPLIPQLICCTGLASSLKKNNDPVNRFMQVFLCAGMAAVMLIRPVLYNGWRHMYFFTVPIFWFIGSGLNQLMNHPMKQLRSLTIGLALLSAGWSANRIISLHPYEYIYLNPLFASREADFDRDYWRLSTDESLKWILTKETESFRISDINAGLNNHVISLFPNERDRVIISQYNTLHRFPSDYLIWNYSGSIGNEKAFPFYDTVLVTERDGLKLAEVFKRWQNYVPEIQNISPNLPEITDGEPDMEHEWRSEHPQNPEDEILIEFEKTTALRGISLLPGNDENEYARSPEISISDDGEDWTVIPLTVSDLFDLSFEPIETKWLRVRNTAPADVHWSIREIFFY